MSKRFKGKYYKHQIGNNTVNAIVGSADSGNFLQIITNERVYHFDEFSNCSFADSGIKLDLPGIKGEIIYSELTSLKSDIMGVFRFFPMQCRHYVYSMHHNLHGGLEIDGRFIDFTGGIGYTEGDSGSSFPKTYFWVHCNDFSQQCSIMASVADIPFLWFSFRGCICAIVYNGKEYRLATYNGVKIKELTEKKLVLVQRSLRLEVEVEGGNFLPLKMPFKGKMCGIVHESNSSSACFKLYKNDELLFDLYSNNVSFECNF